MNGCSKVANAMLLATPTNHAHKLVISMEVCNDSWFKHSTVACFGLREPFWTNWSAIAASEQCKYSINCML